MRFKGLMLGCLIAILAGWTGAWPTTAHAEEAAGAPFGLTWGMSQEDVKALGISLKEVPKIEGAAFEARNLPKALADLESVQLNFGFDDHLWRVAGISQSFHNDPYGARGKSRYEELASLLKQKYGAGKELHHLGKSIYSEPRYFAAGLRGGENWWITTYNPPGLDVELSLRATSSDSVYWVLIYVNSQMEKQFEQSKKKHEKGAL